MRLRGRAGPAKTPGRAAGLHSRSDELPTAAGEERSGGGWRWEERRRGGEERRRGGEERRRGGEETGQWGYELELGPRGWFQ